MRILLVTPIYRPKIDGTVRVVEGLAQGLSARGHGVAILTRGTRISAVPSQKRRLRIIRVGPPGAKLSDRLRFVISAALEIRELLNKESFDVVHTFGSSSLLAGVMGSPLRTRIIASFPGLVSESLVTPDPRRHIVNFLGSFVRGLVLARPSIVTVPSPSAGQNLLRFHRRNLEKRLAILPNGISLENLDKSPIQVLDETYPEILFVGNLSLRKGVDILIAALPAVLSEFPKSRLVIVGSGPQIESLNREVMRLGIKEHVVFAGRVDDSSLSRFYGGCDFLVLPSRSGGEAFGMVLLEAMAMRRPVISTRTPGPEDLLRDGACGLLVRPSDVGQLSDAMLTLARDRMLSRRMGEAGYLLVKQNYEVTKVLALLEKIYLSAPA